MKRVLVLMLVCLVCLSFSACGENDKMDTNATTVTEKTIVIPDIEKLDVETAKTLLAGKGLIPKIEYEYHNDYESGAVIRTEPTIGSLVAEDSSVRLYICKGPQYYELPSSLGAIYDVEGIEPFVAWQDASDGWGTKGHTEVWVEEGYLYISMYIGCKSKYSVEFYGDFGEASINDTFDKSVPIDVIYKAKEIDNTGELTYFDLKIPLSDLGVQKPTNLDIRYYLSVNGKRQTGRANFTLTW